MDGWTDGRVADPLTDGRTGAYVGLHRMDFLSVGTFVRRIRSSKGLIQVEDGL